MSTQWVNTQPDAGAVHALLQSLVDRVPVVAIDQLWIFPTRKIALGESTVVVFSLFDDDPERRRVTTARFTVSRDRKGAAKVQDRIDEHASAPAGAVERVVQGVLRRLGEDVEQPPRNERIDGSADAWQALQVELGAPRRVEEQPQEPAADAAAADIADAAAGADPAQG